MSEARWCDMCGRTFSALDENARRINIEEPDIQNGVRRGVVSVQRDQCGGCMTAQIRRAQQLQQQAIEEEAQP